jgi:sec-independent protein translocase protein TatA
MRVLPDIGVPELLLILVVVVMIFGVGKIPEVGGAIGKSIKEFRKAAAEDSQPPATSPPPAQLPPVGSSLCRQCGQELPAVARFCSRCGTPVVRDGSAPVGAGTSGPMAS